MSDKIKETVLDGQHYSWVFWCHGCHDRHQIRGWEWNGNKELPTFSPSILVRYYNGQDVSEVCHSYVTDGKIKYLDDCTHKMAGQTIGLPDFSEWEKLSHYFEE